MNAVGLFGEWIVSHQLGLEVLLLVLLGVLIAANIVSAVRRERKKKSLLEEIDRKIDGINNRVEGISVKLFAEGLPEGLPKGTSEEKTASSAKVVFGKTPESQGKPKAEAAAAAKDTAKAESESAMAVRFKAPAEEVSSQHLAEEMSSAAQEEPRLTVIGGGAEEDSLSSIISLLSNRKEQEEEKIPPISGNQSIRFYSRDWGTDKHGNVYTEEMLREQIG